MFFPDHMPFNFQMLRMANHIQTGGAELNHLIRVAQEIPQPTGDGWYDAWQRIAREEDAAGRAALAAGNTQSACEFLLRASNYFRVSSFYIGSERPEKLASNEQTRAAFAIAKRYADHTVVNLEIPWRGHALPGYLLLPSGGGAASTVVFVGGADASKEELYFTAGRRLVDRGHAVLMFDGPGQAESWLVNGLRASTDWDVLGPAIFDALGAFPSLDPERVGLLGISMAGYYAPKIASGESRFRCLAVWGACSDVLHDLYEFYPAIQRHLREIAGVDEAGAAAFYEPFNLRSAVSSIACPVLITHGMEDRVVSRRSADWFAEALGSKAELRMFEGGAHCMYNMPAIAQPVIFDWLSAQLDGAKSTVGAAR
jgi:dipeptidyl aminopeptidase/acylaminoacyl peptidase